MNIQFGDCGTGITCADEGLSMHLPPIGYRGIDELAGKLGVQPGHCAMDMVIPGESGRLYSLTNLLLAVVDLCLQTVPVN